ncbi:trimeric intracellular cation channel family protein [Rhizobiales bacterium Sp-1]|uniref:Trimeric intracellular cation channel family protein n=2 Tax=Segnochrobactrum spirostomi TaxID=2608987 RepID=A0A6A7Y607_9HYPH|nr:trimeric intracellular cation channel family protein [Segnochrobactrum spirostomi]
MAGAQRRFDVFGILVLAFVTAVSGGLMRDLLLGIVPPTALANWHMLAISMAGGLAAFAMPGLIARMRLSALVFDAAGLSAFAVLGTQTALDHGLIPLMAAILGMVTGVGGGVARDILTAEVPIVLRSDIYAVAALAGALVVAFGPALGLQAQPASLIGAALCFFLRLMAIRYGWNLPTSRAGQVADRSDRG